VAINNQAHCTNSGDAHFWVLEPAQGPESPGVCQRCGEERNFRNFIDATEFQLPPGRRKFGRSGGRPKSPFNSYDEGLLQRPSMANNNPYAGMEEWDAN